MNYLIWIGGFQYGIFQGSFQGFLEICGYVKVSLVFFLFSYYYVFVFIYIVYVVFNYI